MLRKMSLVCRAKPTATIQFSRPGPVVEKMPDAARHEHDVILGALIEKRPGAARKTMGRHIVNAASRFGYDIPMI